ncbi:MAG: hypothetical protein ACP5TZ_05645 [Nitrososphaeria archaeon]
MNFLESFLLEKIERRNMPDYLRASEMENMIKTKRKEILEYMNEHAALPEIKKLHEDFLEYVSISERVILARRLESGVSTLIYFLYSIFGNLAGIVMAALALITTIGLIGHIILIISILGSMMGIFLAVHSMQKERQFITSLHDIL